MSDQEPQAKSPPLPAQPQAQALGAPVAPDAMQAAPGPDAPLFNQPKMEAFLGSAGPQDVQTMDQPDK